MGIGQALRTEILDLGIVVMLIVVLGVVLLKMRASDSVACQNGWLNSTAAICCTNGTAHLKRCAINQSYRTLYTDVNTYVTAMSEPKNWVIIIIIGIIAVAMIRLFMNVGKAGKK